MMMPMMNSAHNVLNKAENCSRRNVILPRVKTLTIITTCFIIIGMSFHKKKCSDFWTKGCNEALVIRASLSRKSVSIKSMGKKKSRGSTRVIR